MTTDDSSTPATRDALDRTVAYLNRELGGIRGREIEVVSCDPALAGGDQACAEQMAATVDVNVVVTTMFAIDATPYATMNDSKAVLMTWHGASFIVGPNAFTFAVDGTGGEQAFLSFVANELPVETKNIVLLNDGDLQEGSLGGFRQAFPDRNIILVSVPNDGSPQAIADAITSAVGSVPPDAIATYGYPGEWCRRLDAVAEILGGSPQLVLMDLCATDSDVSDLSSFEPRAALNGAYVISAGIDFVDARESGVHVMQAALGALNVPFDGLVTFEALMTYAKVANESDADAVINDAVSTREALAKFNGASILQFGPMACGRLDSGPFFSSGPAACAEYSGVFRIVDGEWTIIANGRNGKLLGYKGIVDVDPDLFPKVE